MNRKLLLICLLSLAVVSAAQAQAAQDGRDAVIAHLEKSKKALADATKGLSEAQWKFKPAPDRWSIAEAYEHITLGESFLLGMIEKNVQAPAAPDKKEAAAAGAKEKDARIQQMLVDRSQKFQAPEPLQPTGRWSLEEMQKEFAARRAHSIEFAKTTAEDLRAHFATGPGGNEMDAVQWLYFLSGHCERHTAQILEVKADPNFPKN
jgi:hypothetical protein